MKGKRACVALLKKSLGDRLTVHDGAAANEVELRMRPGALATLPETCSLLTRSLRARFLTLAGNDERPLGGKLALYYAFSLPQEDLFLLLRVPVDPRHMEVPSVAHIVESANWFEREVRDWFGIIAFPNIRRLAAHPDWPEDVHPMLKSVDPGAAVPRMHGTFDFKHVEGEGVFEIPVGPVHAGIIEPGHFRFSVAGEPIINLDVQLFYTHKGTEKLAEGLDPARGVFLAERVSGDSSFAHALAYCHALERMGGCDVPRRALTSRTLLLELERAYNHAGDIGAILLDVGFAAGAARAAELKESFLRLNEMLTGSRLLRGMARPGGVRRDPLDTEAKRKALRGAVLDGRASLASLMDLVASSSSVMDRLETTGRLSQAEAQRLGVTGIAGRASGIDRDFRRDHPHCFYPALRFRVAGRKEGDVYARMGVRVDELRESFGIIDQLMETGGAPARLAAACDVPPGRSALGYCEGWRGEIACWVQSGPRREINRCMVRDPSSVTWLGLEQCIHGTIVPDFPVCNKSFNASYSGHDL